MRRLVPRALLASVASAALVLFGVVPAGAAVPLPGLVSPVPVSWTPNVFAGTTSASACETWFGGACTDATVQSTAVVNGEVVVAGAFTTACQPGPSSSGHCKAGTEVTRDDIFAYRLGTGIIDPDFVPQLNAGPAYSVLAGPHDTVYVGGAFTTVNGLSHRGLVQLNVTPGNASKDGTVVTAFAGKVSDYVSAMALNGNALYIGGKFTSADSTKEQGDARLSATTGAVDTTFSMPISDSPYAGLALKVDALSLTANGQELAITGAFLDVDGQSRPRVALINTGGGLKATATLADWAAPILANECSNEHDYVRGVDFSPDGSFLVIGTTGYMAMPANSASVCDAAARFPTAATGNVQPTWINYSGGDSIYSVQVAGSVVYLGGHNRWVNNECGDNDVCAPNSVLVMGLSAVDANTGLGIPWFHPLTLRGAGVTSLTTFPAGAYAGSNGGLLVGDGVTQNGGSYHSFDALFPLTSTATSPTFGSIPSGIFSQGYLGGYDESENGVAPMCVDDAGDSAAPGASVEFSTCTNAPEQDWTVEPDGHLEVNGLCLDTAGEATASGTKVDLNNCGSSPTQVWTQGTGNTLINKAASFCLDDPAATTTNGTVLQIWTCDGGVNQVWPLPGAPAPASLTPVGVVSNQVKQASTKNTQVGCINEGSAAAPGTPVQMQTCIGSPQQTATIESDGNIEIEGKCLDTAGQSTASGTEVVLNSCGTSATQIWTQGANYSLVNKAAGLCLNADGSTNNRTPLNITSCSVSIPTEGWRLPAM